MELSLTRTQLLERLTQPQRAKLLALAINEDARKVFPIKTQTRNANVINIDLTESIGKLHSMWFLRAIDLAYDETLD